MNSKMSKASSNLSLSLQNYGSYATVHGMSYIFSRDSKIPEKIFWMIFVIIGAIFATWWSANIFASWKLDPVLTTIEDFAYPIEKIKFPSITICPQGSDDSILGSVLYKQFKAFLKRKKLFLTELTIEEARNESFLFLNETYPGARRSPDRYVKLFRNPENLERNIHAQSNINDEEYHDNCNSTLRTLHRRKRSAENGGSCPTSSHVMANDHGKCYKLVNDETDHNFEVNYSDAVQMCNDAVTDRSSGLLQFMEDSDFTSLYKLLDECKYNIKSSVFILGYSLMESKYEVLLTSEISNSSFFSLFRSRHRLRRELPRGLSRE